MSKVEEVGKQKLAEIQKNKEAKIADDKKKAEARGAASASSAEKEKTKGEAREQAKAQAVEDEKILSSPEEKLDDKQKERKLVLQKVKEKQEGKDKEKTRQENIDKRMGELTGKIKDLDKSGKAKNGEIEALKEKMGELIKEKEELAKVLKATPEDKERENLKKAEETRLKKYLDDDKDKPLGERREMSREDLDNWLLEDLTAAQEWLAERSVRRSEDRKQDKFVNQTTKYFKNLIDKQAPYAQKAYEKHPELNTTAREAELTKEGKNDKEILEILAKENEKFRLSMEIVKAHPEFLEKENGPELIIQELEKRLEKPKIERKTKEEEAKKAEEKRINELVETELKRRESVDEGVGSSTEKEAGDTGDEIELSDAQKKICKKTGVSEERFKARLKDRKDRGLS